jgi:hypothetical protein
MDKKKTIGIYNTVHQKTRGGKRVGYYTSSPEKKEQKAIINKEFEGEKGYFLVFLQRFTFTFCSLFAGLFVCGRIEYA